MSSRDDILRTLRRNRPPETALPELGLLPKEAADLTEAFVARARQIGSSVERVTTGALRSLLDDLTGAFERSATTLAGMNPGTVAVTPDADPHTFEPLGVFVCRGALGVAENGAVWVEESALGHRAAPFLAEHLVLVLDRRRIVEDLHAAYDEVRIDDAGFGLFIAGPSKTADIEQVLVMGAQGPKKLTVVLTES